MSTPRLLLACVALLWLSCASASPHNDQATDRAFDALLSMPQAQPPDNQWDVEAPPGFRGDNEDDLIEWLAQQRDEGADLDGYRHYGTLLQHAVRSRMPKVVRWLLAQGVDPTLPLEGGGDDALDLAVQSGQWPMVKALLDTPSFRRQPPQQLIARYLPYAPDALPEMVRHGFAMPAGDTARCLLQDALARGRFELALQLPASRPLANSGATATTQPPWCSSRPLVPGRSIAQDFAKLPASLLEKLDAKLAEPLLPYLLPTLKTAQDVQALFALPLRQWSINPQRLAAWATQTDPDGTRMPFAVREALARRLPSGMLASMMADGQVLNTWLSLAAQTGADDFARALDQVPAAALAAHPAIAARAIYGMPGDAREWALLLARPELQLGGADVPRLLFAVPSQLWPQLFAHGYRVDGPHAGASPWGSADEAIQWLRSANARSIEQHWPLLALQDPSLVDRSIQSLLYPCLSEDRLSDIRALLQLGARVQARPFPTPRAGCTPPEVYSRLLALGVITRPAADAPQRFVYEPMPCRLNANDNWLKTLTTRSVGRDNYDGTAVTSIQPLDYPGEDSCALLVAGGMGTQEVFIDNGSFFDGPQPPQMPCGDPSPRLEQVWQLRDGHLQTSDVMAQTDGLVPLRDRGDGRRYYLAHAFSGGGRCNAWGRTLLLTWSTRPPYRLLEVDPTSPASIALRTQCGDKCFDIHGYGGEPDAPAPGQLPPDAPRNTHAFIDHFFVSQRTGWIQATLALDTARLHELEAAGAPAYWLLAGIDAVTHSKLPQAERRQRTAWIFRDRTRLRDAVANADYEQTRDTVLGLGSWLPREDWHPLLEALAQVTNPDDPDDSLLQRLADDAQAQGKPRLACRLLHARGKTCTATPTP